MEMRARIKAEIVNFDKKNEKTDDLQLFKTIDRNLNLFKNQNTVSNIEIVKNIFLSIGFDIITKDEAENGFRKIRKCLIEIENINKNIKDYIFQKCNIHDDVKCLLGIQCKSNTNTVSNCSVDKILDIKETSKSTQGLVDNFVSQYLDVITITIFDNIKILHERGLLTDEEISNNKVITSYIRGFIAYLDARTLTNDIPDHIHEKELDSWVLTGYEDKGQVSFIVTLHNSNNVYIRIKANLFRKMKQTCEIFLRKLVEYEVTVKYGKQKKSFLYSIILKLKKLYIFTKNSLFTGWNIEPYIRLSKTTPIEVMEPMKEQPTIRGYVISPIFRYILNEHAADIFLILIISTSIILLYFYLKIMNIITGLTVTLFITIVNLIIKISIDIKSFPIKWIFDNRDKK